LSRASRRLNRSTSSVVQITVECSSNRVRPSRRSGEHAKGNPRQGHVAIAAPPRGPTMPNYSRRARMLRIKHTYDLNFFTVQPTSPLLPLPWCQFFMGFRGPKAHPNRHGRARAGQESWNGFGREIMSLPIAQLCWLHSYAATCLR
jgi:hypothetical protein